MNGLILMSALSYAAIDEASIMTTISNWVCAVIAVIGLFFGGWEIAQGFMDDAPSKRKHGITVLVVGISIAAVIYTVFNMMLGGG